MGSFAPEWTRGFKAFYNYAFQWRKIINKIFMNTVCNEIMKKINYVDTHSSLVKSICNWGTKLGSVDKVTVYKIAMGTFVPGW
jgi:hypothetical protein